MYTQLVICLVWLDLDELVRKAAEQYLFVVVPSCYIQVHVHLGVFFVFMRCSDVRGACNKIQLLSCMHHQDGDHLSLC